MRQKLQNKFFRFRRVKYFYDVIITNAYFSKCLLTWGVYVPSFNVSIIVIPLFYQKLLKLCFFVRSFAWKLWHIDNSKSIEIFSNFAKMCLIDRYKKPKNIDLSAKNWLRGGIYCTMALKGLTAATINRMLKLFPQKVISGR